MSAPTDREPDRLADGVVVPAGTVSLEPLTHDPNDVVRGTPSTGARALATYAGVEVGLWEMTEGVMTDVEADEVFVVLSGRASVVIAADGTTGERQLDIGPGDLVRLATGMRTTWTVHERLRKLYVAPGQS